MSIKDRVRKLVRRGSSSTSSSSSSKSSKSSASSTDGVLYYQPGEKIPYKYKRPVDPAHQAQLEAFSFATSWRRTSIASQYSPMGSRLPSRQASMVGLRLQAMAHANTSHSQDEGGDSIPPNHLSPIESVSTAGLDKGI